jgi:hypothetical protein
MVAARSDKLEGDLGTQGEAPPLVVALLFSTSETRQLETFLSVAAHKAYRRCRGT